MKPLVFIPTEEEKKLTEKILKECIDVIEGQTKKLELKCYILQMLLETFEQTYNVDIRNSISIKRD